MDYFLIYKAGPGRLEIEGPHMDCATLRNAAMKRRRSEAAPELDAWLVLSRAELATFVEQAQALPRDRSQ